MDYSHREIRRIIDRYQELRCLAERVSLHFEPAPSNARKSSHGLEEAICTLVDLDNAIGSLTPRQRDVVIMLKEGRTPEIISDMLGISKATFKFHLNAAVVRIATYLNDKHKQKTIGG